MLFLKYFPWNEKRKLFRSLLANGSKRRSTTTYVHTRYSFSILFKQYVFPNIMLVSCRKMCKKRRDKMKFERRWSGKYYSNVTLTRKNIGGKKIFFFLSIFLGPCCSILHRILKKFDYYTRICARRVPLLFISIHRFISYSVHPLLTIEFHFTSPNAYVTTVQLITRFQTRNKDTKNSANASWIVSLSPVFLRYTVVHQRIWTPIIKNKLRWMYNGVYECLNTSMNHRTR